MSNILYNSIEPAEELNRRLQASLNPPMTPILASEVIAEVEKRCGNGMQYTTFPNTISDEEKQKLEDAGYIVTLNTVSASNRDGSDDLYIGFQVAFNSTAASGNRPMVISQKEGNGGSCGTNDYSALENKPVINGTTLEGNLSLADIGISEFTQAQMTTIENLFQD